MRNLSLCKCLDEWAFNALEGRRLRRELLQRQEMEKSTVREMAELRESAISHMNARYDIEREAKAVTRTLLRDLERQQGELKDAEDKARGLKAEITRLKQDALACTCRASKGTITPRDLEVAECLRSELYHRCSTTVGLVLHGIRVTEILEGRCVFV